MNIFKEITQLIEGGEAFALVTIVEVTGSAPRSAARMVVLPDGRQIGTIGGGPVEMKGTEDAVACIKSGKGGLFKYVLNKELPDSLPMHCGGNMSIHIEVFGRRPRILIGGAGHVNMAVAKMGNQLGYDIVVVDDREGFATQERFPFASKLFYNPLIKEAMHEAAASGIVDDNTYVVIATKDCDEQALRGIIDSNAAYVGVIGSRRKITKIRENMVNDGYDKELLNKVHWPIGLDIGGESPDEIAVSIVSEIMKVRYGGSGESMRLPLL